MATLLTLCLYQDPHDKVLGSLHGMRGEVSISLEASACKRQYQSSTQSKKDHHNSKLGPYDIAYF